MLRLDPHSLRFSTQFADDVTEEVKYLYREYAPTAGRWKSRDPIGEQGFNTLLGVGGGDAGGILSVFEKMHPRFASRIKGRLSQSLAVIESRNTPLYVFVNNDPLSRVDPRGLFTFRVYGNYCGPGWCNGQWVKEENCSCSKPQPLRAPIDSMDSCCQAHDLCLAPAKTSAEMQACDKAICGCLSQINPADIDPPPGTDLNYVKNVWQAMIGLFCGGKVPGH
jgi:RHS repeat-associated protein